MASLKVCRENRTQFLFLAQQILLLQRLKPQRASLDISNELLPSSLPSKPTTILYLLLPAPLLRLLLRRLMLPKLLRHPRYRRLREHLLKVVPAHKSAKTRR